MRHLQKLITLVGIHCLQNCLPGVSSEINIPSSAPTISSAPTACYPVSNWHDNAGDGCDWYDNDPNGDYRCRTFGTDYKRNGFTAETACCGCGGGFDLPEYSKPSANPTGSPTATPTATVVCINDNVWRDEEGYSCADYERDLDDDTLFLQGETRCSKDADRGGNASYYCCECGGGYQDPFIPSLTPTMTIQPTSNSTKLDTILDNTTCMDIPYWVDQFGQSCDFYETAFDAGSPDENTTKCAKYGSSGINFGYTAVSIIKCIVLCLSKMQSCIVY